MKYYTNNSYNQMQAYSGGQVSLECPEKLYLDITQDCNIYCRMCRDVFSMNGKTMPYDLFSRLIEETSPFVKNYSLFNSGEPLIVKDFRERVDYVNTVKRNDCTVEISTNGLLLTDDMINFLCSREVKVCVSFDGADKETFEKIRCGANFEKVCDNLHKLSSAYANVSIEKAPSIYVTIQKDNQNQLLKIAELINSLGVRQMGYGFVNIPSEYAPDMNDNLRMEIEKTALYIDDNKMLNYLYPTRIGDYLWWGNKYIHKSNFLLDNHCTAPLASASIRYDGDVFLCCNGGEYVDNISDKSFLEVWQSKRFNELRAEVNSQDSIPHKCKQCWWVNR